MSTANQRKVWSYKHIGKYRPAHKSNSEVNAPVKQQFCRAVEKSGIFYFRISRKAVELGTVMLYRLCQPLAVFVLKEMN